MVPPLGGYLARQLTVHEQRVAVVTPRTAEVELCHLVGDGDGAVVEDVAVGDILGCRGSSDVAVDLAVDMAVLEPCRRGSEDEVGGALDITIFKVHARARHSGVDGVLIAQQAAVQQNDAVSLGVEGHGLAELRGVVLDGDVLERDIVGVDTDGERAERAQVRTVVDAHGYQLLLDH